VKDDRAVTFSSRDLSTGPTHQLVRIQKFFARAFITELKKYLAGLAEHLVKFATFSSVS
jgi:hypothetical protein